MRFQDTGCSCSVRKLGPRRSAFVVVHSHSKLVLVSAELNFFHGGYYTGLFEVWHLTPPKEESGRCFFFVFLPSFKSHTITSTDPFTHTYQSISVLEVPPKCMGTWRQASLRTNTGPCYHRTCDRREGI